MIATPYPVSFDLPQSKTPRSPGTHVSGIIRCVATEAGILRVTEVEEVSLTDVRVISDPVAITRICMGLAWEEWYIPNILEPQQGVVDHPGEMKLEGVYMTHDGESVSMVLSDGKEFYTLVIHEVKVTYKSTKTVADVSGEWMWLAQIKSYCKAAGTRHARLHVLFVCGDYTYPIKPILACWDLEFTQQELDDNWDMLKQYRDEKLGAQVA